LVSIRSGEKENKNMRIGIAGTGFMGSTHAAAWSATEASLQGFVAKTTALAEPLARQYGVTVYANYTEMLNDIDVVDICTPTHRHYEMVLEAAAAGKHIICEKPLARTVEQGQEMIAACKKAGVQLIVAHVVRFFPEYALARQQVKSGQIGDPAVLRLTRGTFQPKKAEDNWFVEFEKSGGMMLDLMIHDLDYARWVAGEVETVYAKKISSEHPGAHGDHGLVILRHKSGAISHVEGSWAYPPPLFRTRFEIAGSNGWLQYDSANTASIGLHHHAGGDQDIPDVPLPSSPLSEDPYTTQIKAFYHSLLKDEPAPVSGADGLASLQLALAAIESAETGRPLFIKELPEVSQEKEL
jgi:predicted dehydrogenase